MTTTHNGWERNLEGHSSKHRVLMCVCFEGVAINSKRPFVPTNFSFKVITTICNLRVEFFFWVLQLVSADKQYRGSQNAYFNKLKTDKKAACELH